MSTALSPRSPLVRCPGRAADPHRLPDAAPQPATERLPALDALRGAAMLLGVLLHAAISYMPCRMPQLVWAVHDRATSPALDWLFWWIHGFRLPLFFLIAGFFAVWLYESRGPRGYLVNRAKRLLLPLIAAGAVVLPVTFVIFSYGWLVTGQCNPGQVLRMKFPQIIQAELYGLAHLWFLEHLFVLCVGYWAWRRLEERGVRFALPNATLLAWRDRLLASSWKPLWLAVPTAAMVWLDPGAVLSFHHPLLPQPLWLAYYGSFFAAGTCLYGHRHLLDAASTQSLCRHSGLYLLLSLPVLVSLGLLLQLHLTAALTSVQRLVLAVDLSLFAWLMVFATVGGFVRFLNQPRPWVRYLSDASYWIYLVHFPLVALMQVLLYEVGWPAGVKFLLAALFATAVGLVTYRDLVRHTAVGRFLNGTRQFDSSWNYERLIPYAAILAGLLTLAGYGAWHGRVLLFGGNFHEVVAGQVYRSGQPYPASLPGTIDRWQLRSVVNLQGGSQLIAKFVREKEICQQHGVSFLTIDLPDGCLPPDDRLIELVETIDQAPRPMLLHGQYGISRTGLAAAVAELLDGQSLARARRQLGLHYGNLDRTPGSPEHLLRAYELWLSRHDRRHTPDEFRHWSRYEYRQTTVTLSAKLNDWTLGATRDPR